MKNLFDAAVANLVALPVRLMGRLVKPMVFRDEDPLRKNSPTAYSWPLPHV